MSNGGFINLTLAGQLSHKIAAVASVTGSMCQNQITQNTISRSIPAMQIHGTNYGVVNFNGGCLLKQKYLTLIT
ncbi:MAG: hypothetical protein N4A35_07030 [Flavobacteriales bacterium]|jgi:polyhydroxybutyrate depolymerase|nr:hypothetical protein [Flavobacteriales bacterium]